MGDPLAIAGGQVTDWDDQTIEFTGPNGSVRMARAFAPPQYQQQVAAAEQQGILSPRARTNPLTVDNLVAGPGTVSGVDNLVGGPGRGGSVQPLDSPFPAVGDQISELRGAPMHSARAPYQPSASVADGPQFEQEDAGPAANVQPGDPLQPAIDRIRELRSAAVYGGGGGGASRTTTTTTRPADPAAVERANELQTDVDIAQESGAMAREEGAAAESDAEKQLASLSGQQAADFDRMLKDDASDRAAYDSRVALETAKLQKLQDASRTEIDPGRWWSNQSTGKKILAGLAAAFGGYSAGLKGGQNQALGVIQQAIARDVDAQLANRDDKRQAARDQAGFMSVLQDQYADRAQARKAGIIIGQELVAAQAERIAHTARSETVKQKAREVSAALKEQALQQRQQLILQAAGQTVTQTSQMSGGAGGNRQAREAAAVDANTFLGFDPSAMVLAAERYTGFPMQAIGGKEDAREINKQMADVELLDTNLQKLEALGKRGFAGPSDKALADSLYAKSMLIAKNIDGAGALDVGAVEIMKQYLGTKPTDWVKWSGTPALSSARAGLRANTGATLRNRTGRVNPDSVPLALRARFAPVAGGNNAAAAPKTQPLTEEMQ